MFKQEMTIGSIAFGLFLNISPQIAVADGFTGADLLEWSAKSQEFYFQTSVTMAGVIAAQMNAAQARCIDHWHERQHERKYEAIVKAIRKYPSYHPQGVIFGLLKKACGAFR